MGQIILTSQLRERGFSKREIERLGGRGELSAVRRGVYLMGPAEKVDAEGQHRRMIEAAPARCGTTRSRACCAPVAA